MQIQWDELASAMMDQSGYDYYLDTETGDVIPDFDVDIDFDQPRYIQVDRLPSWMSYNIMVDFKDSVKSDHLKDLLEVALQGKGAFRRFKDVLLDFPEERERWFAYEAAWQKERVNEWLADNDLPTIQATG